MKRFSTFAFCLLPFAFCLSLSLAFCLRGARADPPPLTQDDLRKQVHLDQKLNAQVPLDIPFRDETGQKVPLQAYFGRQPVMLILIQYRCRQLCSEEMKILAESLKELKFTVGDEFQVVTVSIDEREGSGLAAAYKAGYVKDYGRPGAAAGWHFLTGDADSIGRLADAVGYHFVYDPRGDQFMHPAGLIVLTPEGKVARYFFRLEYPPRDLKFALMEAAKERIGSPLDEIALICFHYNPAIGKYTLTILGLMRLMALATVLGLGTAVTAMGLRERHLRRRAEQVAAGSGPPERRPEARG